MTKYLVLYRRPTDAPDPMANPDPVAMEAGKAAWGSWLHDAGPAVVDFGAPTRPLAEDDGLDRVSGFTILETETQSDLDSLLSTHPHGAEGSFEVHAFVAPPAGSSVR